MAATREFSGLNNVTDPVRLGTRWLVRADNIDVTESGGLRRRSGYERTIAGAPTGVYATRDESRLYVVEAGDLRQILDDMTPRVLASGLSREVHWTEFNDQVLYVSGDASGIVEADGAVLPWRLPVPSVPTVSAIVGGSLPAGQYRVACTFVLGDGRETPASTAAEITAEQGAALQVSGIAQLSGARTRVYIAAADSTAFQLAFDGAAASEVWSSPAHTLGMELQTLGMDPLPHGVGPIAIWRGRAYASMYLQETEQSVIWRSEALAPHLWNLGEGFFMVPGRVLALAPNDAGLFIGTDRAMHALSADGLLSLLDSYGVVAGWPWAEDGKRLLVWTTRGLCQFPEFANLTERRISVAPGIHAAAAVIEQDGQTRFVASLHAGGIPFNQRKRGAQP